MMEMAKLNSMKKPREDECSMIFVAKSGYDVVSVCPETDGDGHTTKKENSVWHRHLGANLASFPGEGDGCMWADGIRNIIGTVAEG